MTAPRPRPLPVIGFAAHSGSGKTTLLERMIPLLTARGLRVGVVKHAHHRFDVDYPGKDSYRLRKAGAVQTLVGSDARWALIQEHPEGDGLSLEAMIARLDPAGLDLILVEGFKPEPIPKIEVHRPSLGKPLVSLGDPDFIAIATDAPEAVDSPLPLLPLNDPAAVCRFVLAHTGLAPAPVT